MVAIRLAKYGRKKSAFFRIVAVDSTKKNAGKNLEILGYWNPIKNDLKIDKEKVKVWVAKGAQVSATVKKLIK